MATAALSLALPLLKAAAPLLVPEIFKLVTGVERLFGAKTGQTKLDTVLAAITPLATQLASAGKIPGVLDETSLVAMIESAVHTLKAAGLLGGPATDATIAAVVAPGTFPVSGTLKIG